MYNQEEIKKAIERIKRSTQFTQEYAQEVEVLISLAHQYLKVDMPKEKNTLCTIEHSQCKLLTEEINRLRGELEKLHWEKITDESLKRIKND